VPARPQVRPVPRGHVADVPGGAPAGLAAGRQPAPPAAGPGDGGRSVPGTARPPRPRKDRRPAAPATAPPAPRGLPPPRPASPAPAPPARPTLPPREELGVTCARSASPAGVDWNAAHRRLDRLGALGFHLDRLAQGGCRVTFLLPTAQPERTHHIETTAATEA